MVETYVCPRCGTAAHGASTCTECAHDLDAESRLPTAEEYEAGGVEAAAEAWRHESDEIERAAWSEQYVPPFKSPWVRGQVVKLWLIGGILVDITIGALSVVHLGLIDDAKAGAGSSFNDLVASEDRLAVAYVALLVVFLITAVFFMSWFYRAYKNLPALGGRPRHSLGWTIGAWFIPIVSWIIPKRITNDIWRGSVAARAPELHPQLMPVPFWVHVWWALFIIGNLLGNASSRAYGEGDDLDDMRVSTIVDVIATPIYVVTAILAWMLVDRISKAQDAAVS